MGWIKHKGKWYKCDDEKVTAVTKQTIKQLKGGSEAHSVYLCFYSYIDSNACCVCWNSFAFSRMQRKADTHVGEAEEVKNRSSSPLCTVR